MEGFTIIDGVVAVVIILSAILAYSRGFVREGMAILGWIAAAVVAFLFAPKAEPLVKEIPLLKEFIADSCELSMIAAFAAVFAIALVVVSIFTPLFSSAVQRSALSGIDQGLGFLFGVVRGLVLVAVAFLVYDLVVVNQAVPMVDDSRSAQIFASATGNLQSSLDEQGVMNWITTKYEELVGACAS
ncbi:colicin V production protein [Pseudoruegeria aquimaris]|uniref:Colicin V production protein n=1 Tax=Pseudoruegeria aquimaris TaxID=393663 RepID=A0A1Y5SP80_9RHOB|nr:CvpA family protein [Pseudoruegeria aquimaris]SLN42156.1 colicin V production protein [Pseudoruegeria aquimaris]